MDKFEDAQIRLLLEHLSSESRRSSSMKQGEMHAEHAAKGTVRSGATIKRAVEIAELNGREFIEHATQQVGKVSKTIDAFNMIVSSFSDLTSIWDYQVAEATRLATTGDTPRPQSTLDAADVLLIDCKRRLFRELQIHRFAFARADTKIPPALAAPVAPSPAPPRKNKGGKPLAAHWDEMWAFIAVQLYVGDLKPTSQKQIKDAMFAWFNAKSIDAGDTAVTDRARQLWQKIEASQ